MQCKVIAFYDAITGQTGFIISIVNSVKNGYYALGMTSPPNGRKKSLYIIKTSRQAQVEKSKLFINCYKCTVHCVTVCTVLYVHCVTVCTVLCVHYATVCCSLCLLCNCLQTALFSVCTVQLHCSLCALFNCIVLCVHCATAHSILCTCLFFWHRIFSVSIL